MIIQNHDSKNEPLFLCLGSAHELVVVDGLDAARTAMQSGKWDIVISNVFHSGWNMFDFLKEVKSDLRFRKIPIIYFCSRRGRFANIANNALKSAFHELGAVGFLAIEDFYVGDVFSKAAMQKRLESLISCAIDSSCGAPTN